MNPFLQQRLIAFQRQNFFIAFQSVEQMRKNRAQVDNFSRIFFKLRKNRLKIYETPEYNLRENISVYENITVTKVTFYSVQTNAFCQECAVRSASPCIINWTCLPVARL